MEALKRKLNSRRGASILLALLFMLMCILVAASVVMAAASNAGKIKSNKEEQQKYLTLSSAVNLLVDELQSVEYVGGYTYEYVTVTKEMFRGSNGELYDDTSSLPENVEAIDTVNYTTSTYTYTLQPGTLQYQTATNPTPSPAIKEDDWKDGQLENLLPMNEYLDYLFRREFESKYKLKEEKGTTYKNVYNYDCSTLPEPGSDATPRGKEEYAPLTLTVNGTNAPGDLPKQQVKIVVTLEEDGRILLKATLYEKKVTDDGTESWPETSYQMVAVLKTRSGKWPVNVINLNTPKSGLNPFDPVRWKLAYIYKVEDNMLKKAGGGT